MKTSDEIRQMLLEECASWGGQKIIASKLGVSEAFISAVACGKKQPSENMARFFGYMPVTRYVLLDEQAVLE